MASLYTPTLTYNPVTDPQGTRANHYQIERSPGDGFIYEAVYDPYTDTATPFYRAESLIIATAGSFLHEKYCYPGRDIARAGPRASYSVFFGPGNDLNDMGKSLVVPPGCFQSRQRGELTGAIAALRTVDRILSLKITGCGPVRRVIIKTDSEYLAKGATEWVFTWIQKGWIMSENSRVKDWDLWEKLMGVIDHIKRVWGVEVAFWWVPPRWNKDARSLAGMGLRVPPDTHVVTSKELDLELSSPGPWIYESVYHVKYRESQR
ncbi:hypothetical protein VSDG_10164 [Cytospora chrysosperma]|uniref:ribonuclease H n=1 Tax=Cytospora chrysosperma TaxID=252740 RepID=A0A423V7P7_CYTCH|nr:hypothetical protein VSDG_10164 [Valsa sordida]